jgi:hypothetical protein
MLRTRLGRPLGVFGLRRKTSARIIFNFGTGGGVHERAHLSSIVFLGGVPGDTPHEKTQSCKKITGRNLDRF